MISAYLRHINRLLLSTKLKYNQLSHLKRLDKFVTSVPINNLRHVLVFIALLAYCGQAFASVGGMSMVNTTPSDQKMASCHGSHPEDAQDGAYSSGSEFNEARDCCDTGCSMMACHSACAVLSRFEIPLFYTHEVQNPSFKIGFIVNVPSSLFRPPILS